MRLHKNLVRVLNSRRSVPLRWLFLLLLACCLLMSCWVRRFEVTSDEGSDTVTVVVVVKR